MELLLDPGGEFQRPAAEWARAHGKPIVGNSISTTSDSSGARTPGSMPSLIPRDRDAIPGGPGDTRDPAVPVLELAQVLADVPPRPKRRRAGDVVDLATT